MVEGVVGGGLGVVALLALGRAEVVAGGIGPWVVVVGVLVGHGDGVVERSRCGELGLSGFDALRTGSGLRGGMKDGWWELRFCFLR